MAVFLCSVLYGALEVYPYIRERRVNHQLAEQVRKARTEAGSSGGSSQPRFQEAGAGSAGGSSQASMPETGNVASLLAAGVRQPLPQYAWLYEQNPDFFGWLRIDGTNIDYPVVYTPKEPEYYLHRDFYGNFSGSGCLFLGDGYVEQGGNTIIYGHHMRDGSMFAGLLSYAVQEFARDHSVIYFDTLYEEGVYETAAAFYCSIEEDDQAFPYYAYPDLTQEDVFYDYVNRIIAESVIDTGVEFCFGDELLLLSTCSYHKDNGRFVVVARKVKGTGR